MFIGLEFREEGALGLDGMSFCKHHFVPENNPHLIKIKVCCLADSARIRPIVAP